MVYKLFQRFGLKKKRKKNPPPVQQKQKPAGSFTGLLLLLVIFCLSLIFNQFVTLEQISNTVNPLARLSFNQFFSFFTGLDKFFLFLIFLIPAILIFQEFKNRAITKTINKLPLQNHYIVLYLFLISLICLRSYFAHGRNTFNGDSSYYFYMASNITASLKKLQLFPTYTFMHGGGAPANQFYGPLHSYISGTINLFFNNPIFSNKMTLFLLHFFGVVGFYFYLKELFQSRTTGFFGGLASILLYHHTHIVIYPGRYGIAAIWAVYPFLYYFLEHYIRTKKFSSLIFLSFATAGCVFASIGMSYYFLLFFGLYTLFRIILLQERTKTKLLLLLKVSAGLLFGLILSSYYLFSFLVESKWSIKNFFASQKAPTPDKDIFLQTFLWNNYQLSLFKFKYAWQTSYFGISLLFLSFAGIAGTIKKKNIKLFPLLITLIFLLFYITGYGKNKILLMIPYLHTYSLARSLNIAAFLTVVLSTAGVYYLTKLIKSKHIFFILILLVFIDLFPTTFHDTYSNSYDSDRSKLAQTIRDRNHLSKKQEPLFRVDILGEAPEIQHNWRALDSFMALERIPIISEQIWDYVPVKNYINHFHIALRNRNPAINFNNLLNFYYLFNTKYLITTYSLENRLFAFHSQSGYAHLYEFKENTPILTTTELVHVENSTNDFFPLLNDMGLDRTRATAGKIPVLDLPSTNLGLLTPELILHSYSKKRDRINYKLSTTDRSFVVLGHSAYPTMKILLDGSTVSCGTTAWGFIVLYLDQGEHEIVLAPRRSKQASIVFHTALILFVLAVLILMKKKLRKFFPNKHFPDEKNKT